MAAADVACADAVSIGAAAAVTDAVGGDTGDAEAGVAVSSGTSAAADA